MAFFVSHSTDFVGAEPSRYFGLFNANESASTLAVELDISKALDVLDINDNHVGIDVNRAVSVQSANASYYSDKEGRKIDMKLVSGQPIQVWVDYEGTTLRTRSSEERTEDAEIILGRDLSASMEKEWEVLKNDDDTPPVLEHANTETTDDNKESKNLETFESLVQVDHQVTEQAVEEKDSEPEKTNTFHEETMVDQTDGDSEAESEGDDSGVDSDGTISEADSDQADHQEIEVVTQENDSEAEKIITLDEDTMVKTDGDSESEQEGDDSGIDSNGTISEADSNQLDHQETEQATQENDSETEKINAFDEDTMVEQTGGDSDIESEGDDDSGAASDGTISEADSYQAIQGTDIADGKVILPESEGSITAPTSPLVLEEAPVETAPLSPFVAEESVSAQFPRPNKSASKNSAMKLVDVDNTSKENSMEMMMMMNVVNGESKGEEAAKKNEKVDIDEENLKDVSMRKLVKMVKELSIKSSNNRTALQMLPGNNQIAE
uniref:Legume lectin domain-containing protein n=1 Tax=Brassica oleracea var. oleracea TaxID=109376 RepID=A0A0D3B1L0_BRAOL